MNVNNTIHVDIYDSIRLMNNAKADVATARSISTWILRQINQTRVDYGDGVHPTDGFEDRTSLINSSRVCAPPKHLLKKLRIVGTGVAK